MRFAAPALPDGKGVRIPIPFDPNDTWGAKAKHYVTGTVAGCRIRAVLERKDGEWFLRLGPAWVRDQPLPHAELDIVVMPEGPQIGELAEDVERAFTASPAATAFFNSLATYYRKGFVDPIEEAKRPETRAARIAEMIALLEAGKDRK